MTLNFLNQSCSEDEVFQLIAQVQKIKELVLTNYDKQICEYTPERSFGNYDDVFNDGYECGQSWLAYSISQILDMDLPEPELPDDF